MNHLNYNAYLNSEHWKAFRKVVLRKHPQCLICNGMANTVHHLTYVRIGGELLSDVRSLCTECHNLLHKIHAKTKLPYTKFDRVAKLVKLQTPGAKGYTAPRPKPEPVIAAVVPVVVPERPTTPLMYRLEEIKKYLFAGYHPKKIAIRRKWELTEVLAVVAWIKASVLTEREAEWLKQIR